MVGKTKRSILNSKIKIGGVSMYKILESPKRMTPKQVIKEFKGKWIFLVDLDGSPLGWFKSAIPMIVADEIFEGSETGIYRKLNEDYNGNTFDWSLLPNEINVFGFSEVLPDAH